MEYIKEGYTLPVPFNLIPTISSIKKMYNLVTTCWAKIKRHEQDQTNNNAGHVEGIRQKENLKIKTTIIFVFFHYEENKQNKNEPSNIYQAPPIDEIYSLDNKLTYRVRLASII